MEDSNPESTPQEDPVQEKKNRLAALKQSLKRRVERSRAKKGLAGQGVEDRPEILASEIINAKTKAVMSRLGKSSSADPDKIPKYEIPPAVQNGCIKDFTTIYVLGSASSGKTTLINRLLDRTEVTKPTIALDFTFARRTVHGDGISDYPEKKVCTIWELGGDATAFATLVETPVIINHALDKMAIFLILDLSEPEKLWPTFNVCVKQLKHGVTDAMAKHSLGKGKEEEDLTKKLEDNIMKRLGNDLSDKKYLEPFALPIVMICTKFDLFQNFEPERRKQVSRILRLASHRLGASLNYFSKNEVSHSRRVRELFTHYAFGTRFPKEVCHDFNKGLQIPHGGDSYEQIWPGSNPGQFTFDYFKHLYESQVGKPPAKRETRDNTNSTDDVGFREPGIDSQKNIAKEELRMLNNSFKEFGKRGLTVIRES